MMATELAGNEQFLELLDNLKHQKPFPHTLLYGPSGVGKTELGNYIASLSGTKDTISVYAPMIDKMYVRLLLSGLNPHTVVILDEIHSLKKDIAETLYDPMENFTFQNKKVQPFTLVGITTDLHRISDALILSLIHISEPTRPY